MKLKRLREDFVVDEVSDFPLDGGPFAIYRLDKSGIGTPEAISEILKQWNLSRKSVSYGGLKDRHAETSQNISIFRGPQKNYEQRSFRLTYLGQAKREFHAKDIVANRFVITLRSLRPDEVDRMTEVLPSLAQGVPNYFDDQRFGSLGESGQFVAEPWCRGDYERALYLAMAEANTHDQPREREQKAILRDLWGNWIECKNRLDRSHRRSVVTYLVDHPTDFKRAIALIRIDLRSIYVAAFQSYLWNELACQWWRDNLPAECLVPVRGAANELLFFRDLPEGKLSSWESMEFPLPSARQRSWPEGVEATLNRVLAKFGMDIHGVRLKYPRDTFFSKGHRSLLVLPKHFSWETDADELGRQSEQKLTLRFELPRGSYATMIVKVLSTAARPTAPFDPNSDVLLGEVDDDLDSTEQAR